MRNRRALALGAAVIVTVGLSACTGVGGGSGGPDAGGAGAGDTGEVKYLIPTPENAAETALIEENIANFEEQNPGITVTVDTVPLEQLRTILQTQLRSGSGPDVFRYDTGPGYAGALNDAGLLYSLTEAYEENDWPVYEFAQERVTFDDEIVGVPDELETIGVFYNQGLFEQYGVAEPESVSDLIDAAQTLQENGVIPFAFGNQEGWPAGHILSMALSSAIGPEGVRELLAGERSWDSPEVVDALELVFGQFRTEGFYPESTNALNYDDATALFYSGQAAMVPTGTWLIPDLEANADFEVGFFPFPAVDSAGVFTGGIGEGIFVSASAQDPEAAVQFVDYLVSEESGRFEIEQLQLIPAFPVDTGNIETGELLSRVLERTEEFASGSGELGENIDVNMSDTFNKAMSDGIQAMLDGSLTAEELAAQLQAAAEASASD